MKPGDKIWFLDSGSKRMAIIVRITRTDAVIKFVDRDGGIRISVNRLFESENDIDDYIGRQGRKVVQTRRNQYDYM